MIANLKLHRHFAAILFSFAAIPAFAAYPGTSSLVKTGVSRPLSTFSGTVVRPAVTALVPPPASSHILTTPKVYQGLSIDTGQGVDSDTNLAVSTTQMMQWANFQIQIYDKLGNQLGSPISGVSVFSNSGTSCANSVSADGLVKFDRAAQKWLIVLRNGMFNECIAISQTSDATGIYNTYLFTYQDSNNPQTYQMDYPKIGIWTDGYYVAFDELDSTHNYAWRYAEVCALDRSSMIAGAKPAAPVCEQPTVAPIQYGFYHLMPADLDGSTLPPAGSPNYQIMFAHLQGTSDYHLYLFKFHVNFANPSLSTFSGAIQVDSTAFNLYAPACQAGVNNCIPQPPPANSGNTVDSVGGYMMYRFAYRNLGSHESLVATQAVNHKGLKQVGIRWYEVRTPNTKPKLYQSGFFTADTNIYRWLGSAAMDNKGNLAMGYSISSGMQNPVPSFNGNPGIGITARLASDPINTIPAANEIIAYQALGVEVGPKRRWGAYSSIVVDPVDDCTFWYVNQYLPTVSENWSTQIVSFKVNSCTPKN